MVRKLAGISLVLLLLSGAFNAVATAQQPLSPADYTEIQQLYYLYADAFDRNDAGALDKVFTQDAEFVSSVGPKTYHGLKEIGTMASRGELRARPKIFHVMTNVLIKPSAEGARGQAYVITIDVQKNPSVTGNSVYQDVIVKTKDGWRIKKREMFYERAGAPQSAAQSPQTQK